VLDVVYPENAVIVISRLQDAPDECVQPAKFGDCMIIWSPLRDTTEVSLEDRTSTNAVVVNNLLKWLEQFRCIEGRFARFDAATTDQGEGAALDYQRIYHKLFQKRLNL
jgi:hypothetical protein